MGPAHPLTALENIGVVHAALNFAAERHMRGLLEDAVDHGVALLAALGLPQVEAIDVAIELLDALDEPLTDLEPSLGSSEIGVTVGGRLHRYFGERFVDTVGSQVRWGRGGTCDLEEDDPAEEDDHAEDGGDSEPSLGSLDRWPSQAGWAGGGDDDREGGDDDREPSLSVVEFDGRGDNWHRSGRTTEPQGPDIEAVDEDGGLCLVEDMLFAAFDHNAQLGAPFVIV